MRGAFFAGWEAAMAEIKRRADEAIDNPDSEGVKGPVT
jgi:hypothetical protein